MRTGSWVIQNTHTGEYLFETWNPKLVRHLNTPKYVAIPIATYLANLNREIKAKNHEK